MIDVYSHLKTLKKVSPIIHSVTNLVVMQITANILLTIGASPIMAHASEELSEIVLLSQALVLNIGTLDSSWQQSFFLAQQAALKKQIPIILDPVGAGASRLRTNTAKTILSNGVTILRGNASEILALADGISTGKGVDSQHETAAAKQAAEFLAKKISQTYQLSVLLKGGHLGSAISPDVLVEYQSQRASWFSSMRVATNNTYGTGCTLSSTIAALLAKEMPLFNAVSQAKDYLTLAINHGKNWVLGKGHGPVNHFYFLDTCHEI